MFGLTDPEILHHLKKKSDAKIPLQIFYDPSASSGLPLTLSAWPIHGKGLMHQKILVIDEKLIFLGSANMTKPSFRMHDNLMVSFHSPELARFLIEKAPRDSGNIKTKVGGQEVELWLLPDLNGDALNAVKSAIQRSRKTLRLAMFTLTHPLLVDALIEAARRGVDVTVAVDTHAAAGASLKAVENLKKENIRLLYGGGTQLFHYKFLYSDEETLLLGSANWTKAAFAKNRDSFLILYNLTKKQKDFMNRLWKTVEFESKTSV